MHFWVQGILATIALKYHGYHRILVLKLHFRSSDQTSSLQILLDDTIIRMCIIYTKPIGPQNCNKKKSNISTWHAITLLTDYS